MPDNTILNPGAGGDTFAADEISSVKYPRSKIVLGADGVNDGDVSSANPMPVAGEVTVSGSVAVTGTFYQATQPVSGTFWQATQPVSGTFWQATQPVSAAALPLPSGAATEAKQDTGNTSLASAVTALQIIDNIVQVDDADFTDNTTPGVPVMGVYESTPSAVTDGDLGVAGLTSDRQLKVFDSGVVTAVTGVGDLIDARITACNTGAVVIASGTISLPSGASTAANQSTIITSVQLLDDWDESDRAKVNVIVGQAGITGGAGAVGASTPRVTLASDDPAVVALQTLDNAISGNEMQVDVLTIPAVAGAAAEDAAASGNPVPVGLVARRARITAMSADGDVVRATADRYGRQQVVGADLSAVAVQATASGDTALVAAPGAGNRLKIVRVKLCNSHASTALTVGVKTAAHNSGSVFEKNYLPAAGGQAVINFPLGHLICGDNEAFNVNLSATGQIECTVYYEVIAT